MPLVSALYPENDTAGSLFISSGSPMDDHNLRRIVSVTVSHTTGLMDPEIPFKLIREMQEIFIEANADWSVLQRNPPAPESFYSSAGHSSQTQTIHYGTKITPGVSRQAYFEFQTISMVCFLQ